MKDSELLLAILAQLEREKTVSIPQLSQLLDCDEERVFDALETLVFAYDAASIRLDLHSTYATLDSPHGTRLLRLTSREADVLVDALGQAGFTPKDELVQKILESKGILGDSEKAAGVRMMTIGDGTQAEIAQILAAACEDDAHHLLSIEYRGEGDTAERVRIIEPVVIFSGEGKRYLLAYCRSAQGWRSFRLDRIKRASALDECFAPRDDIPTIMGEFSWKDTRALVRIEAGAPLPSWHKTRVVRTEEDGSRVLRVDWNGGMWLAKRIVAMTGDAIALEPPELVEACRNFAQSLRP